MIITHQGQSYEITNWDEFRDELLEGIGIQVENEIIGQINSMRLVDTGRFKGSITSGVSNGELVITSTVPYAVYLEYGTYAYWQSYGLTNFPKTPDPKKKDISRVAASKLPKGMQPFAPFRRVLYNPQMMGKIINNSFKSASK